MGQGLDPSRMSNVIRREVTVSVGDRSVFPRRSPEQIRNRQFVWVRKGYDPEQVQDFLGQLADLVDSVEAELRAAREELQKASSQQGTARDEAYTELAKRMADMLQMADAHAETVRKDADQQGAQMRSEAAAESERTRKEAEADAERVRRDAQADAERVIRESSVQAEQLRRENEEAMRKARTEAEHIVSVLSTRRDMLLQEVQSTRERLLGVLDKVNQAVPPVGAPAISQPVAPPQQAPSGERKEEQAPAAQPASSRPAPTERTKQAPERKESDSKGAQPSKASKTSRPKKETGNSEGADKDSLELVLPEIPALEEELES
jgi:DivIVA domain-containing protein